MTTFEKSIQKAIIAWLKARGAYVFNVHGSAYTPKGTPDLLCCVQGVFVAIEVKGEKGKVSELQQHRLDTIAAAGGIAFVARSVADVEKRLQAGAATISFHGE